MTVVTVQGRFTHVDGVDLVKCYICKDGRMVWAHITANSRFDDDRQSGVASG